jgi:hypothetical protein
MAILIFRIEPLAERQVEMFIPDEKWISIRDNRPEGEPVGDLYEELKNHYETTEIQTLIYGGGEAFDVEILDCDCKKTQD